jgi:hypothetical protein
MTAATTLLTKALAVAILFVACLPMAAAGFWAYQTYLEGQQTIADELDKLDRLRAIAAHLPVLERMKPDEKTRAFERWFMGEGTPAMLTAGLQAQLRQLAAAQGVEVLQANEAKPKEVDKLTYLGVALEMSGTASALHGILNQIEASVPLLFLDNINIRSDFGDAEGEQREPLLIMTFQVYGAVMTRGGGASQQSPAGEQL